MRTISNIHFIHRQYAKISERKPLSISNDETIKKRVILSQGFRPKNKSLRFNIQSPEGAGKLLLLNSRFQYVKVIPKNTEIKFNNLKGGIYHIGITVPPKSNIVITKLLIDNTISGDIPTNELLSNFTGDTLVLAPGYPSTDNMYSHAFIHTRVKLYRDHGIKNIDVAIVNDENINQSSTYRLDGITVNNISYSNARILLQQKKYKRILVHFFGQKYAQILDASDTSATQIFIYTHGGDVLYKDHASLAHEYFRGPLLDTEPLLREFSSRDLLLKRYNSYSNVHWIFATEWCKNRAEELLGATFSRSHVISNPILSDVFSYQTRAADDRKKICIVRPFNKLSSYSIDISVRTILELSKRPFFSDIEFSVYGTGETHDLLVKPILDLPNVTIHNTFLSSSDLAKTYQDHGIVLMPTRYDSQGVSACEAAMTGAVVISSDGNIGLKDCIDPSLGTYCETEDFREYADLIEKLYFDESRFLDISRKMHEFTFSKCSEEQSIEKELTLFENTKPFSQKFHFKPKISKPLLTIAVPSYNVEQYLKNGVLSLIDHPLAHKLEVLIVNDGSSDKTASIGLELENLSMTKNGPIVKIINKENGGHGSTINKGIELATGKYFRLMDGDDYFSTDELVSLLEKLETETSDIVLTNYIEDFSIDAFKHPVHHYSFMEPGLQYDLDVMQYKGFGFGDWGPLLSTTTCKTSILKGANFKIDENAFYVDMEYNFMIYASSKTVVYYPLDIYNYYLGRVGQSMSKESFTRNYLHHEKVTLRLIDEYIARKESLSEGKRQYLVDKLIIPMCKTQYLITLEFHSSRQPFISFDSKLKKYKEFYYNHEIAGRLIRLHRGSYGRTVKAHIPLRTTLHPIKRALSRIK